MSRTALIAGQVASVLPMLALGQVLPAAPPRSAAAVVGASVVGRGFASGMRNEQNINFVLEKLGTAGDGLKRELTKQGFIDSTGKVDINKINDSFEELYGTYKTGAKNNVTTSTALVAKESALRLLIDAADTIYKKSEVTAFTTYLTQYKNQSNGINVNDANRTIQESVATNVSMQVLQAIKKDNAKAALPAAPVLGGVSKKIVLPPIAAPVVTPLNTATYEQKMAAIVNTLNKINAAGSPSAGSTPDPELAALSATAKKTLAAIETIDEGYKKLMGVDPDKAKKTADALNDSLVNLVTSYEKIDSLMDANSLQEIRKDRTIINLISAAARDAMSLHSTHIGIAKRELQLNIDATVAPHIAAAKSAQWDAKTIKALELARTYASGADRTIAKNYLDTVTYLLKENFLRATNDGKIEVTNAKNQAAVHKYLFNIATSDANAAFAEFNASVRAVRSSANLDRTVFEPKELETYRKTVQRPMLSNGARRPIQDRKAAGYGGFGTGFTGQGTQMDAERMQARQFEAAEKAQEALYRQEKAALQQQIDLAKQRNELSDVLRGQEAEQQVPGTTTGSLESKPNEPNPLDNI